MLEPTEKIVNVDTSGSIVVVTTTTQEHKFESLDDAMDFVQSVMKWWHIWQKFRGIEMPEI